MKINKKILAVGLMMGITVLSMAQGGGQGRRFGMMGGAGANPAMLLQREDVQEDLKLTDDQKSKLGEMRDKMMEDMRSAMQEANGDREAMGKIFQKMQAKATEDLNKILTIDQQKRLKEISVQMAGNAIVMNKDYQKDLALTPEQITKITDLQKKQQAANQSLMEKARNGEMQWSDMRPIMEKNQTALNEEIGKVLTDAQKAKLKEMAGKTFVKKDEQNG